MTSRQQWAVVAGIIAIVGGGVTIALHAMRDQLFPVEAGSKAPDFRARPVGSRQMKTIADYHGKVVLLNVWTTWCEPCRVELPSLEKLYREYGPKGLHILAVSEDDFVSDDSIRAYARNFGMTFEILVDSTHDMERIYQTTGYPETFVIGPEGTIRKKWIGPADWASPGNRALIAQLLGLSAPSVVQGPDSQGSRPRAVALH